jgi:hypothetical protein
MHHGGNINNECHGSSFAKGLAHECETSIDRDEGINTAIRFLDKPLNDKIDLKTVGKEGGT